MEAGATQSSGFHDAATDYAADHSTHYASDWTRAGRQSAFRFGSNGSKDKGGHGG
jgi:hypothetical protein